MIIEFQVICEKIFLKKRFSDNPDRIFSSGFLESKHLNVRLEKVLNHCANPSGKMCDLQMFKTNHESLFGLTFIVRGSKVKNIVRKQTFMLSGLSKLSLI